jgi:hypothetical protein
MSSPNLPRGDDASLEQSTAETDAVVVGCLHGSALAGLRTDRYRFQTRRRSWSDYVEAPSAGRIAIGVRGDGFDTYRYRGIPYPGALLLAETPRTVIPATSSTASRRCSRSPSPRACARRPERLGSVRARRAPARAGRT